MAKKSKASNDQFRVLNFNDLHWTVRPPSSRVNSYTSDLAAKLAEVARLAHEWEVDLITCTGDWFHSPEADAADLVGLMRALEPLRPWFPIPTIMGNHDAKAVDQLDRKALMVLQQAGVVRLLNCEYAVETSRLDSSKPMNCAAVFGAPYTKAKYDRSYFVPPVPPGNDDGWVPVVVLTHASVWTGGQSTIPSFGEWYLASDMAQELCKAMDDWPNDCPMVVCNGHIHTFNGHDFIVWPTAMPGGVSIKGVAVLNHGSIARTSRAEVDHEPCVSFVVFDADGSLHTSRVILNTAQPASKVFTVQDADAPVDESSEVKEFVAALQAESEFLTEDQLFRLLNELSVSRHVNSHAAVLATEYLEKASMLAGGIGGKRI